MILVTKPPVQRNREAEEQKKGKYLRHRITGLRSPTSHQKSIIHSDQVALVDGDEHVGYD